MSTSNITVLYAATYYVDRYVRQEVLIDALRRQPNLNLKLCVVNSSSRWRYVRFLFRYWQALRQGCDVVILGWRGVELFPLIRIMTRAPIIYDAFLSVHETLCLERRKFPPNSVIGRVARWFDQTAVNRSAGVFCDTKANAEYFVRTFNLPTNKMATVYVGADRKLYYAGPPVRSETSPITVLFYGSFLPLHGVDIIIQAANALRHDQRIRFCLIGDGPTYRAARAGAHPESHIEWIGRVNQERLADLIAGVGICLGGPFSLLPKAQRVVTGKTYQFLAMGKPVIVGDTPGNRELLQHEVNCLMVPAGDSTALAAAIKRLAVDLGLRERLSEATRGTLTRIDQTIAYQLQDLLAPYARKT